MSLLQLVARCLALLNLLVFINARETLTTTDIVGSTIKLEVEDAVLKAVTPGIPYTSTITSLSGAVTEYIQTIITPTSTGKTTAPAAKTSSGSSTSSVASTKVAALVYPYTTTITATSGGVTLYISTVVTGSGSGSTATVISPSASSKASSVSSSSTTTLPATSYTYTGTNPDPSSNFTVPPKSPVTTLSLDLYYTVTDGSKVYTSRRDATSIWVTVTTNSGVAVVRTTYVQRFTSQYTVMKSPSSGSIGLGTITGTVGVVKTTAIAEGSGSSTTTDSKVVKIASANSADNKFVVSKIPMIVSFLSIFFISLL
ncbi:hypothetical protein TPHA_0A00340 [Tetrapisispora phaffii CBS 4417]|uniref:Protein KRE1 n=1 Tax=Tetrapisispora phaffii (strain ATCC 24235 / CBS 4417 / NBRC 1672 / NRRL Y-8282 / UCD 70-5) TaxID=1071381 RepID=G8BMJ1_TETPH|nr:hypothetical protein TPHA_0A00340 [Tetrapisispora phaffii CBS 4417]CCE61119.1 hypothetical protein TPHA_0A00340 [Tetrapisispora phaffii CBS 4417]